MLASCMHTLCAVQAELERVSMLVAGYALELEEGEGKPYSNNNNNNI